MNIEDLILNVSEINQQNIKRLFIPLDTSKKIAALSVFLQIKHNNEFIDTFWKTWAFLFDIKFADFDFQENKLVFDQLYNSHDINRLFILKGLEGIPQKFIEFCRWTAILFGINKDYQGVDEYLSLGMKIWEINSNDSSSTYSFNLIKTKIDLLIDAGNFNEAYIPCSSGFELLDSLDLENTKWLKYQYAVSLVEISKNLNILYNSLHERLENLEFEAETFDKINY